MQDNKIRDAPRRSLSGPKFSDAQLSLQLLKRKASFADFINKPPTSTSSGEALAPMAAEEGSTGGGEGEAVVGVGVSRSREIDPSDLLASALFLPQSIHVSNHPESPIDNVRRLLEASSSKQTPSGSSSTTASSDSGGSPPLFCEMLYLSNVEESVDVEEGLATTVLTPSPLFWQQTNRWIRYEQVVEGNGTRFSKPHITLLTVHSLLQVKNCLKRGLVLLDVEAFDFATLVQRVMAGWVESGYLEEESLKLVRDVLNAPKMHLIRKKLRKIDEETREEAIRERRGSTQLRAIQIKPPTYVLKRKLSPGGSSILEERDEESESGDDDNRREDVGHWEHTTPSVPVLARLR